MKFLDRIYTWILGNFWYGAFKIFEFFYNYGFFIVLAIALFILTYFWMS
jgi:hypothetical protein